MDMEMIHRLAPVGFTVDHKAGPLFGAALFHGQLLGLKEQIAQKAAVRGVHLHDIPDMLFGDYQKMNRPLGGNVVESQHPVIFVNFPTGNFPGDNFTKNAVAHDEKYKEKKSAPQGGLSARFCFKAPRAGHGVPGISRRDFVKISSFFYFFLVFFRRHGIIKL
jgi:hypothetical protein